MKKYSYEAFFPILIQLFCRGLPVRGVDAFHGERAAGRGTSMHHRGTSRSVWMPAMCVMKSLPVVSIVLRISTYAPPAHRRASALRRRLWRHPRALRAPAPARSARPPLFLSPQRGKMARPKKYGRSVVHLTQLYAHPDGLGVYAWTHGSSKPTPWRQTTVVQEEILDGLHRRSDGETIAAR